jgi:hypothetical protein
MSATGIEPMTNHLGDRNVTIMLLGCWCQILVFIYFEKLL